MKKKILTLFLAGAMVVGSLTACGSNGGGTAGSDATKPAAEAGEETAQGGDTPLVVGTRQLSEKFSPFLSQTEYDKDVVLMTSTYLADWDRTGAMIMNAADGETIPYNGKDYQYNGLSNITVTQDEANDKTIYNFKLREDVTFSDGQPLTADDVIFSLYVYMDPDYDGYTTINTLPIAGLKNYQANSTLADSVTADDVNAYLQEMPEALEKAIIDNLIMPTLIAEKDFCTENFEAQGAASAEEFFVTLYGKDEAYDGAGKDFDTIVKDVAAMYGADYKALAANYAGDEVFFDADVYKTAESQVIAEKAASGAGEEVPNIEGIQKLGEYEVEVTTNGFDASAIYQFQIFVSPLHYYGDKAQYDYENNSFGFPRGDISLIRDKTPAPMGSGPYKFLKYENKIVYYEANQSYFEGAPKTKHVQFKETDESDKTPGVQQGTIDLTDPDGSKLVFEQIGKINGTGEISGDKIITNAVDNLGYGYIGVNAKTVNVGGEPGSEASKNLRKGLNTIFSVYRDVAIDSYYGDAASIVNYPISNTSWAAPQKSDEGYQVAFSVDVSGNPIYTEAMSAEEKYAKAAEAALGFFEAAGYTVKDGKLTAAPAGAKLSYEVIIGAEGNSDHPSFGILTDAKSAFEKIGLSLEVNNPTDGDVLWNALDAMSQEIWVAAWQATADPDMYQTHHSQSTKSNNYGLADPDLDQYIMDARQSADQAYRKSIYKECLNIIVDWGVELPVYQRQNCIIYSPERINADTFTPDVTTFYKWMRDIKDIEMK